MSLKTRNGKDYYLHVTFEYTPEVIEPKTYIGVDRGLANLIGITVTDDTVPWTAPFLRGCVCTMPCLSM